MSLPTETPFQDTPAPWDCKGEAFWLFGYASSSKGYPSLSEFSPLEGTSAYADQSISGRYKGGLTSIMVVRYTKTPVGPYDELIWVPGTFEVPPTGKAALRITRIYVSTKASVYNGRKNWNTPKSLAHFEFIPSGNTAPGSLPYSRITVASPSAPDRPFFALNLTPTYFLSSGSLPYNSKYLPLDLTLVHPPLPESARWREDGEVGTDKWISISQSQTGKAGFFRAQGGLGEHRYGDDVGFPDVQPWSLGMWLRDFAFVFPVGVEVDKKQK